jgi:cytochrome c peroxidase
MPAKFIILSVFIFSITAFSFLIQKSSPPAEAVKLTYLQQAKHLEKEISQLQKLLVAGNEKQIQQQFFKTRQAYKQAETVIAYYFNYYANKLNGPPIPFFEESEPDVNQQQPLGMQLVESFIFPHYKSSNRAALSAAVERLLSDVRYMQATNESNAFNDDLIFDAVTEELYRITALGLTGFDSQAAINGLPECNAALQGVQKILLLYAADIKKLLGEKENKLQQLLGDAQEYLKQHNDFNAFNRMEFITAFLDPVSKIVAEYKLQKNFEENRSPMFYSAIKKNNSLFAAGIFNADKYLDDYTTSAEKIALGKKLFFDKQLSLGNKRSCATCHDPARGFADGLPVSIAMDGHTLLPRNAPTIWNAALQRSLFFDSRSATLEDQVMQVLNNAKEMHGSAQKAAETIIMQQEYKAIYATAYPAAKSGSEAENICNAIACYERTLLSLNAKFDQHMRGKPVLTQQEIGGFNLFMGKAKCGTCHFMPLFSGAKPPRYYYTESEVVGVPATSNKGNAKLDADEGRFNITGLPLHKYAFKTSTLRNIALTAPYMHNGVFKTLEEVLDFYNNGGGKGLKIAPANQTLPFDKLGLSATEKKAVIAFLKTLTDTVAISANSIPE